MILNRWIPSGRREGADFTERDLLANIRQGGEGASISRSSRPDGRHMAAPQATVLSVNDEELNRDGLSRGSRNSTIAISGITDLAGNFSHMGAIPSTRVALQLHAWQRRARL
jgi:hypothetical protein